MLDALFEARSMPPTVTTMQKSAIRYPRAKLSKLTTNSRQRGEILKDFIPTKVFETKSQNQSQSQVWESISTDEYEPLSDTDVEFLIDKVEFRKISIENAAENYKYELRREIRSIVWTIVDDCYKMLEANLNKNNETKLFLPLKYERRRKKKRNLKVRKSRWNSSKIENFNAELELSKMDDDNNENYMIETKSENDMKKMEMKMKMKEIKFKNVSSANFEIFTKKLKTIDTKNKELTKNELKNIEKLEKTTKKMKYENTEINDGSCNDFLWKNAENSEMPLEIVTPKRNCGKIHKLHIKQYHRIEKESEIIITPKMGIIHESNLIDNSKKIQYKNTTWLDDFITETEIPFQMPNMENNHQIDIQRPKKLEPLIKSWESTKTSDWCLDPIDQMSIRSITGRSMKPRRVNNKLKAQSNPEEENRAGESTSKGIKSNNWNLGYDKKQELSLPERETEKIHTKIFVQSNRNYKKNEQQEINDKACQTENGVKAQKKRWYWRRRVHKKAENRDSKEDIVPNRNSLDNKSADEGALTHQEAATDSRINKRRRYWRRHQSGKTTDIKSEKRDGDEHSSMETPQYKNERISYCNTVKQPSRAFQCSRQKSQHLIEQRNTELEYPTASTSSIKHQNPISNSKSSTSQLTLNLSRCKLTGQTSSVDTSIPNNTAVSVDDPKNPLTNCYTSWQKICREDRISKKRKQHTESNQSLATKSTEVEWRAEHTSYKSSVKHSQSKSHTQAFHTEEKVILGNLKKCCFPYAKAVIFGSRLEMNAKNEMDLNTGRVFMGQPPKNDFQAPLSYNECLDERKFPRESQRRKRKSRKNRREHSQQNVITTKLPESENFEADSTELLNETLSSDSTLTPRSAKFTKSKRRRRRSHRNQSQAGPSTFVESNENRAGATICLSSSAEDDELTIVEINSTDDGMEKMTNAQMGSINEKSKRKRRRHRKKKSETQKQPIITPQPVLFEFPIENNEAHNDEGLMAEELQEFWTERTIHMRKRFGGKTRSERVHVMTNKNLLRSRVMTDEEAKRFKAFSEREKDLDEFLEQLQHGNEEENSETEQEMQHCAWSQTEHIVEDKVTIETETEAEEPERSAEKKEENKTKNGKGNKNGFEITNESEDGIEISIGPETDIEISIETDAGVEITTGTANGTEGKNNNTELEIEIEIPDSDNCSIQEQRKTICLSYDDFNSSIDFTDFEQQLNDDTTELTLLCIEDFGISDNNSETDNQEYSDNNLKRYPSSEVRITIIENITKPRSSVLNDTTSEYGSFSSELLSQAFPTDSNSTTTTPKLTSETITTSADQRPSTTEGEGQQNDDHDQHEVKQNLSILSFSVFKSCVNSETTSVDIDRPTFEDCYTTSEYGSFTSSLEITPTTKATDDEGATNNMLNTYVSDGAHINDFPPDIQYKNILPVGDVMVQGQVNYDYEQLHGMNLEPEYSQTTLVGVDMNFCENLQTSENSDNSDSTDTHTLCRVPSVVREVLEAKNHMTPEIAISVFRDVFTMMPVRLAGLHWLPVGRDPCSVYSYWSMNDVD